MIASKGPKVAALGRLRRSVALPGLCLVSMLAPLVPRLSYADGPGFSAMTQPGISDSSAGVPEAGGEAASNALGSASVDPSTGVARSQLAFELPHARGGAQPHLALSYSSTGGNGSAGWGWSLGVPSIERKNLSGPPRYHDPQPGSSLDPKVEDRFAFGGQPLVPICFIAAGPSGSVCTGAPGETMPAFAQGGWHYFRLENDSAGMRFFWSPDHVKWVVQHKSGETWELGGQASDIDNATDADTTAGAPGAAPIFRWNLSLQYDAQRNASGQPVNFAHYAWQHLHPNQANAGYLTDVYDTPAPGNVDTSAHNPGAFAHHVRLAWEVNPDAPVPEVVDPPVWHATPVLRLKSVDVTVAHFGDMTRELLRRYHLGYQEISIANQTYPNRSFLTSFQLEGQCSQPGNPVEDSAYALPAVTSCKQMPAVTMKYSWPAPVFNVTQVSGRAPSDAYAFDVNSDGLPDLVGPGDINDPSNTVLALSSTGIAKDVLGVHGLMPLPPPTVGGGIVRAQDFSPYYTTGAFSFPLADNTIFMPFATGLMAGGGTLAVLLAGQRDNHSPPDTLPFATYVPAPATNPATTATSWLWQELPRVDAPEWGSARHDNDSSNQNYDFREQEHPLVIADLDGDGYPDAFTLTGVAQMRQRCSSFVIDPSLCTDWVHYTASYNVHLSLRLTRKDPDGRIRLFADYAPGGVTAEAVGFPNVTAPAGSKYFTSFPNVYAQGDDGADHTVRYSLLNLANSNFLEDLNGDGLLDWVSMGGGPLGQPGGVTYWRGQGNGLVGTCADGTLACSNDDHMQKAAGVSMQGIPSGFNGKTLLHDVNGDGLADLIVLSDGGATVLLNRNGLTFAATNPGSIPASQIPGWSLATTKVVFADMNGSGVDDIVFLTDGAAAYVDVLGGVRPGLLTDVDNGKGATTHIDYASTTDLARCSRGSGECTGPLDGKPWQTASSQVLHVVTKVTTSNNLQGPAAVKLVTEYSYSDPIYDGRDNMFRGFLRVRARTAGDASDPTATTETTFLSGQCQTDLGANGWSCDQHEVDRPFGALSGRPVLVESYDASGKYLSTAHTQYRVKKVAAGLDGRSARFAYAEQTDTLLYDTTQPTNGSAPLQLADAMFDENVVGAFRSVLDRSGGAGGSAHVVKKTIEDSFGNVTDTTDLGVKGVDAAIHSTATWALPPGDTSGWNWRQTTTHLDPASASPAGDPDQPRDVTMAYDAFGNLTRQSAVMRGAGVLNRFHETGASVAPQPPTASVEGANIVLQAIDYTADGLGNVYRVHSPTGGCQEFAYDPLFKQLSTMQVQYTQSNCGNGTATTGLTTIIGIDRGFEKPRMVTAPDGAVSTTDYDGFGRVVSVSKPDPLTATPTLISQSTKYDDPPGGPLQYVTTSTYDGTDNRTSVAYIDGLGNPVLALKQADRTAGGDGGDWVVSGGRQLSAKGAVARKYKPFFWSGSVLQFPLGSGFPSPSTTTTRDAFGRVVQTLDEAGQVVLYQVYRALATDTYDAENLPGARHAGAYTTTTRDGHGRPTSLTKRNIDPASGFADTITTTSYYTAAGEVSAMAQSHTSAGDVVLRSARYDSFGRMVENREPNASVAAASGGASADWRYVYDDDDNLVGTSDARGCGKNLVYDAAGRTKYEDYSPCLAAQLPYSAPRYVFQGPFHLQFLGAEVRYFYDALKFGGGASLPTGRLNAIADRAAFTQTDVDFRGRVVETRRQLAAPGAPADNIVNRYTPHTFVADKSYDELDRPTRESTGVDGDLPLLMGTGGQSAVTTTYSARGAVLGVGSSYGVLVSKATYDARGRVLTRQYGDAAQTLATYAYDPAVGRLKNLHVTRTAPHLWGTTGYPAPSPTEPTQQLELENTSFQYDNVGNPTAINDATDPGSWPVGAKPRARAIGYDSYYRVARVDYSGPDSFVSPVAAEVQRSDASPVPMLSLPTRVMGQSYTYDWLGNMNGSADDLAAFYDRSLGTITNGVGISSTPNRLLHAQLGGAEGGSLDTAYDAAGNLTFLTLNRNGACGSVQGCVQTFEYDWDEVGALVRARRFDGNNHPSRVPALAASSAPGPHIIRPPPPPPVPAVDIQYTYDAQKQRVMKASSVGSAAVSYSADIFPSLRLENAAWNATTSDYDRTVDTEKPYLVSNGVSLGRVVYSETTLPTATALRVYLELTDHLDSTSFVIDLETGELVERVAYQPYGAVESDYRPTRWGSFREEERFTGKLDDFEVGLTYMGARYYSPALGRWLSPDPLTVHGMKGDLNPYAYVSGRVLKAVDPDGMSAGEPSLEQWQQQQNDPYMAAAGAYNSMLSPDTLGMIAGANAWMYQLANPTDPFGSFLTGAANVVPDSINFAVGVATFGNVQPNLPDWAQRPAGMNAGDQLFYAAGGLVGGEAAAGGLAGLAGAAVDGAKALRGAAETAMSLARGAGATAEGAEVAEAATVGTIGCFEAGTLVATADGLQPIETLRAGDLVVSRDEKTGETEVRPIVRTFEHGAVDLVDVIVEDRRGGRETLHTTAGHPFWVEGRGWMGAGELRGGEALGGIGEGIAVARMTPRAASGVVYNFEVEHDHTYFVGREGAWVHNVCPVGGGAGGAAGDASASLRNGHLAGSTHPVTGVPFDANGYPDFKAAGVVKTEVKITQTGTRPGDFRAANKAAGLAKTPEDYTWHHHQDGTTMQLVPEDIHLKTGHTGGFRRAP